MLGLLALRDPLYSSGIGRAATCRPLRHAKVAEKATLDPPEAATPKEGGDLHERPARRRSGTGGTGLPTFAYK